MPIVGTLPFPLVNGTTADATQVQGDLQFIADQVNANAAPIGITGTNLGSSALASCILLSAATVIVNTVGGTILNDTLHEWTPALGRFTAANTGIYQISYNGTIGINATDIANASVFVLGLFKNGGALNPGNLVSYAFSGAGTFNVPIDLSALVSMNAGDFVDARMTAPTFTVGTAQYFSLVAVRRIA